MQVVTNYLDANVIHTDTQCEVCEICGSDEDGHYNNNAECDV